jgi:hypothetical protein
MYFRNYVPLRWAKGSFHMKSSMKITYIFLHNLYKALMLWQLVNFLFDITLSSDFLQGLQIMRKLYSNTKIALVRHSINLPVAREITLIKMALKKYNLRIKSGMCESSIVNKFNSTLSTFNLILNMINL